MEKVPMTASGFAALGEELKKRCDELLKNAEMRIEKITLAVDGKPKGVVPLDGD